MEQLLLFSLKYLKILICPYFSLFVTEKPKLLISSEAYEERNPVTWNPNHS